MHLVTKAMTDLQDTAYEKELILMYHSFLKQHVFLALHMAH